MTLREKGGAGRGRGWEEGGEERTGKRERARGGGEEGEEREGCG